MSSEDASMMSLAEESHPQSPGVHEEKSSCPASPERTRSDVLRDEIAALKLLMEEREVSHDKAMCTAREQLEESLRIASTEAQKAASVMREELRLYEAEKSSVSSLYISPQDIIELQIGSRCYTASRALLTKEKGWLIEQLLARNPEKNRFFIDRDGEHFNDILYWLRTGYLHIDLFGGSGASTGVPATSVGHAGSGGVGVMQPIGPNGGRVSALPGAGGGGAGIGPSSSVLAMPHGVEYKKIRQLRVETQFYGLRRLTRDLDSLLSARMSTHHKYAVLTYSSQFQPVSFLGEAPEGIELFEYEADCFKSFKDMRKILTEMASSQWFLETTIGPSPYNGRLVFYKREDHGTHPLLTEPVLSREGSKAVRNSRRH